VIPFDFEYYRATSIPEAIYLFQNLFLQGRNPLYYGGGTEIITLARTNRIYTEAVIDIKGIPECNVFAYQDHRLLVGSAVSLTRVSEEGLFPLLSRTCSEAADQTARNKITVGGNICGHIIFREAVLAFLLADSDILIAGPSGINKKPIHEIFKKRMRLQRGEFVVQVHTDTEYTKLPFIAVKKRRIGSVGYPVVAIAAMKKEQWVRVAFSGVCAFPFRSHHIETILNDRRTPLETRIERAVQHLPAPLLSNTEASADYRAFVLKNTLFDVLTALEEV
jgi:CO/xanthine dehydrogenase FAD-binding subunit